MQSTDRAIEKQASIIEAAKVVSGAEMILSVLVEQGVRHVFGYPGGTVLPIYDAVNRQSAVKIIRPAHEQGGVHAAEGYARATGKVGVVLVTSGPGATNTVTGIADAFKDSVPLVVMTGQVNSGLIGTNAFQECDIVSMTKACTKRNYQVCDVADLPRTLREAFRVAKDGRPGPVLVDIPKDIQFARGLFRDAEEDICVPKRNRTVENLALAARIEDAIALMREAKRPVFYTGGGVVSAGPEASRLLRELADETGFPVTSTLMGLGAYPASGPLWLGMPGMHGAYKATMAMYKSDLIIAVGARFDDRVTANVKKFAPDAKIIHIDIDAGEIGKIVPAFLGIKADCRLAMGVLLGMWRMTNARSQNLNPWRNQIAAWRKANGFDYENSKTILKPQFVMHKLGRAIAGRDAFVVTDVGQNQMWAAQHLKVEAPNRFITSGGMGTMGFGLPAAIGVQTAFPDSLVVCISGDGGLEMSSHEMMTATRQNLPIKLVLINNRALGMVRQWQDMFHEGCTPDSLNDIQPDFIKLAEAYGWRGLSCISPQEVDNKIREMIDTKGPCLLECRVDREENCYPIIPPGGGHGEVCLCPSPK